MKSSKLKKVVSSIVSLLLVMMMVFFVFAPHVFAQDNNFTGVETLEAKENETKADTRQPWVARIVAEGLLNKDTSAFATFSFDGEDAGNIVINEKYNNSTLHVKYSLDNEKTWKDVTLEAGQPHKISLNDQLDSIKPETDIKVSLEGTTVVHVIDI